MMYCEKTPGRRLRPAVKESCDRSLSPCHLRTMILTALLMLFSMGVGAKVTVETGKFTGGTVVEKTQTENAADGTVTVTLTVTPAKGYAISKKNITVVATIAPSSSRGSSRRNAPEIGDALELKGDDPKDLSQPRDYTVTVDANLGVWVKEAKFKESGAKAGNPTPITSLSSLTSDGDYIITEDIDATGYSTLATFNGTLTAQAKADGTFPVISNLSVPLFTTATDATISNIILKSVSISQTGIVGSIACTANGTTRIYNCGILSGSVGSTGTSSSKDSKDCCGGLVGELSGTARVINCYSYATITGGNRVGGIVGYNNGTTTAGSINTMVMNCMFYGDITKGITVSPIYGGNNFSNVKHDTDRNKNGLNTFNYYAYDKLKTKSIDYYNCALAVEEKYLNRFEFYRLLLNSNKKLAAFYATGSVDNADKMAKWVLETADRSISGRDPYPYPILKAQGYYPSIINPDFKNAPDSASVGRNMGGKLGKKLEVNINIGSGYPEGAGIKSGKSQIFLERTDKDEARFNFNYDKVQLPYYNDVGTKNYTGNKVVTGWKITSITTVDDDPYSTDNYDYEKKYLDNPEYFDYPNYNFADRNSSNKDKFSVSGRVFSQGAYFDVPYGVTSITIEPYWGKAVYVADQYYDVVYKSEYSGKQGISQVGSQITTFNGQTVSNSINVSSFAEGSSVYDNAVVLVGNLHLDGVPSNGTKAFTMMSVDEDNDHEPDHSLIYHHKGRLRMSPIRFDFLDVIGTAQAQKPNGASLICNMTICRTRGWFEITNTSLMYFSQFEYENLGKDNTSDNSGKVDAPLILQGGVFDQFVSTQNSSVNGKVIYIHVGGNVWMHEFSMGTHSDGKQSTPHVPVSVTGGDFDSFYLTGTYNANADVRDDNAECYISGGRFGELAGGGQEQIGNTGSANNGNVRWQIYDADITDFFGGGVNDAKPVQGNITTDIYNSHVTQFCGGPKFGNMASEKNVKTTAEGCVFGKYFGAGYGGNSISRKKYYDKSGNPTWSTLEGYYSGDKGKYFNGSTTQASQQGGATDYGFKGPGVATDFDYEFFVWSSGTTGARLFVEFVSFSLAQCNDVESTLKSCKILENFYGGGSLGKVSGKATSTLEDCEVTGNVFGAGYSATLPTIPVRKAGFTTKPKFNSSSGMFEPGVFSGTDEFTWKQVASYPSEGGAGFDGTQVITTQDISHTNLGSVGTAILTIKGNTTVGGSVYGGGEESVVGADTEVIVTSGTIGAEGQGGAEYGNVYGGGKGKDDDVLAGLVKGNTKVEISNGRIYHNVYGGGAYGSVGDFEYNTSGMPTGLKANTTGGKTEVYITGGTIGWNGKENGMVFGSSRGDVGTPEAIEDKMAWVHNTHVIIGKAGTPASGTEGEEGYVPATAASGPDIMGSVYGSGENGHVFENTVVDVHGGTVGISSGVKVTDDSGKEYEGAAYPYRGNVYGGGCGTDMYDSDGDNTLDSYNPLAGIVQGNTTVTIDGGHVVRNVYGAGAMGSVGIANTDGSITNGLTTVAVSGGTVGVDGKGGDGNVFGAARGDLSATGDNLAQVRETSVTISSTADVKYSVYGGGEAGVVKANTTVSMSGGSVNHSVFGGGELGLTKGSVIVNIKGGTIAEDVYGGGSLANTNTTSSVDNDGDGEADLTVHPTTTVKLTGGTVEGNAYGGGLGQLGTNPIEAKVYGDVLVTLNETETAGEGGTTVYNDNCVVKGSIFGCNNLNGSPQGKVTVHIYKTQGWTDDKGTPDDTSDDVSHQGTSEANLHKSDAAHSYHLAAVYGGGNMAAYTPKDLTTGTTNVIIDGCGRTSIQQVYGGGNAASTPATCVTINGTYEIEEVFGGGNGKDDLPNGDPNPGANVGFYDYSAVEETYPTKDDRQGPTFTDKYVYGSGKASVNIFGGTIHRVFGGSNTKGNVRQTAVTMLDENSGCDFCVDEAYGGGKSAPMDAEAKLLMACIPGLQAVYGGAEAADIQGNVTLNITNGTFDRVFGGNNKSGTIRGFITVNIEEIGCKPIIIGELYGGGNLAGYSVYGYKQMLEDGNLVWKPRLSITDNTAAAGGEVDNLTTAYRDPEVNVMSFTSIGSVYGGGYGAGAVMVGNPHVNINVVHGEKENYTDESTYINSNNQSVPYYDDNGFKELTKMIDGHSVTLPQHKKGTLGAINNVFGGGNAAEVKGNTNVNIGTEAEVYLTKAIAVGGSATGYYTRSGKGTEDSPYVYKEVTSGLAEEGTTYYEKKDVVGADIRGNVYGGGNNAAVTGDTNVNIGKKATE